MSINPRSVIVFTNYSDAAEIDGSNRSLTDNQSLIVQNIFFYILMMIHSQLHAVSFMQSAAKFTQWAAVTNSL